MASSFGLSGLPNTTLRRTRASQWYPGHWGGAITAAIPFDDRCIFTPFWGMDGTIDRVAYEITIAGSAASGTDVSRIGLYDDDGGGKPTGSALFQTADLDNEVVAAVKVVTVSWAIRPKLYWLSYSRWTTGTAGTAVTMRLCGQYLEKQLLIGDASATPVIGGTAASQFPVSNYEQTMVAATQPTIGGGLAVGSSANSTIILVRYAA